MSDETPKGLMLEIANAHDDHFRWRVAAACVKVAKRIIDDGTVNPEMAYRAIWNWTEVGEVMARFLIIGLGGTTMVDDETLENTVHMNWSYLAAGMPAKE